MSFSNLKSVTKTADAAAISGRTRVVGIYYTCTGTASSFSLRNGAGNTDDALVTIYSPAAASATDLHIPDMGVLFDSGVYVDVADGNIESVTLFFEGGAAA